METLLGAAVGLAVVLAIGNPGQHLQKGLPWTRRDCSLPPQRKHPSAQTRTIQQAA